jgi:glycosyltransferase involved in cell wall biosynthesis
MRVLMLSRDESAIVPGSATFVRMEEYRALTDVLRVIVVGKTWNIFGRWDIVTAQDPFETGFVGWILARFFRAQLQLQIHTDFLNPEFAKESLKNNIRVSLAKFLLPRADCIRVVSKRIADSLKANRYQLKAVPIVLPIYTDTEKIRNAPIVFDLHKKYPQFENIILMASRLTREKNIEVAIDAMRDVVRQYPRAGLIIVGEGPEQEKLKAEVRKFRVEKNVVFEDWTDKLDSYYKTAEVFLLTSRYEGYGRTLVEAAAAGCPIVSTDVGLAGETLSAEDMLVVVQNKPEKLAEKLMRVIGSPPLRKKLSERAGAAVQKMPTKEEYLKLYKELWLKCGI